MGRLQGVGACAAMSLAQGLTKLRGCMSNTSQAMECLNGLKVQMAMTPGAERMTTDGLAAEREIMESAVLLSVQAEDAAEFERHMALLTPYYTDFSDVLPPSENHFMILGLDLLRLLAQNRIAGFHTKLETIPTEALSHSAVQFSIHLEQNMMEGSYTKVLEMQKNLPHPHFGFFMGMLQETLRDEVATVSEKAYKSLPAARCIQLLMLSGEAELHKHVEARGWRLEGGVVHFETGEVASKEIPATPLIAEMLHYAKEL